MRNQRKMPVTWAGSIWLMTVASTTPIFTTKWRVSGHVHITWSSTRLDRDLTGWPLPPLPLLVNAITAGKIRVWNWLQVTVMTVIQSTLPTKTIFTSMKSGSKQQVFSNTGSLYTGVINCDLSWCITPDIRTLGFVGPSISEEHVSILWYSLFTQRKHYCPLILNGEWGLLEVKRLQRLPPRTGLTLCWLEFPSSVVSCAVKVSSAWDMFFSVLC